MGCTKPANPWAGEVVLVMDGQHHVCKLTLGALAEMEAGLADGGLIDLVERFETGAAHCRDRGWPAGCGAGGAGVD